ncbi:M50 family metallopeptidase [Acidipropionibacterium virtanenii]|uniref:M50 family metallopeptidase n=1 Tax=Acidipropionibacterium virtanenii TaxID=2057246 RepID=UPI000DECA5E8|nr:M50 family metallopeptidase [Acidipropionibacterium virtanenii]
MQWSQILDAVASRLNANFAVGDPVAGRWLLAGIAVALACILVGPLWRLVRPAVTLVHELGHAVVGVLSGRRFTGFVISADMSGHTTTVGRPSGPGMVLTAAAGYPMPALIGAAAIGSALAGRAGVVLLLVLIALLVALFHARSLFTVGSLVLLILIDGYLWWAGDRPWAAAAVVWLGAVLLLGGWRHLAAVALHGDRSQDPGLLAAATRVPAAVWNLAFATVLVACSWWAWRILEVPVSLAVDAVLGRA